MGEPKVDLAFHVMGRKIPVDHGYALYAAVSRVLPGFHEEKDAALGLIRGRYIGDGLLDITPNTEIVIRIPANRIASALPLAGKTFYSLHPQRRAQIRRIGPSARYTMPEE